MSHKTVHIHAYSALGVVPPFVLAILNTLEEAGFEAWIVGGYIRDALRGITPHDADIATNALWQDVRRVCTAQGYKVIETGTKHGTVTVVVEGVAMEVTTFREEGAYSDHRRPDEVHFVDTIEQDLARRDFTVNAMAYHPIRGLVDPFNGQHDITRGVIRCVGIPEQRFEEDYLRVLRAIRFASQLDFRIEPTTERAAFAAAPNLPQVAPERLASEIEKLLCGCAVHDTLMAYIDILGIIIPELLPMKGFDQHTRWHVYTVLEHTAYVVQYCPPYPLVRWAALFHDSGKPQSFVMDSNGIGHMPGHPAVSAEHLLKTAKRFHFSRKRTHELELLVRFHDYHPSPTRKSVAKLFAQLEHNEMLFHAICDLMRADALGQAPFSHKRVHTIDDVEALFNAMQEEGVCLSVHDLPISGQDIMALGVPAGPLVGQLLNDLLQAVINEEVEANREALLALAKTLITTIAP